MRFTKLAGVSGLAIVGLAVGLLLGVQAVAGQSASALTPIPPPKPKPGSYGLEATKSTPPPADAPHISTPGGGSSFTTSPITVTGLCKNGLLVQVYDNNVMVGAVTCKGGSFSVKVSPFTGKNVLSAIQFDDLYQASPVSNKVTVSYNNLHLAGFGQQITLTSNYGRRGADPGDTLSWPLQLSGGTGPYAFSIDWGDGKPASLKSQALAGNLTIQHVYDQSGIYTVTIRVTDKNGVSAFLQVVAVANGKPVAAANKKEKTAVITKVIWIPAVIALLLLIPAYWLGRRSELVTLHRHLEEDFESYNEPK